MRKPLSITMLAALLLSCASKPPAKPVSAKPVEKPSTLANIAQNQQKPENTGEYYTINIANPAGNDNTASYGTIVSAKPAGYKVVRKYFPALAQNFRQKYLILHYTALNNDKSAMVLTQQAVSAHYLVNDMQDSEIYQLVDENKRSYHAGVSTWRNDKMLNDTSIGIEIVNPGYTVDSTKQRVFAPFPAHQIKKVAALAQDIAMRYNIPPTNILAHSDIAPTRKQDPGPLFPWKKLHDDYRIGMWYDENTKQLFYQSAIAENFNAAAAPPATIFKIQTALQQFGYGLQPSGTWDSVTKSTIEAFQFHFRPEKCDGFMDAETWAILQALQQKYPR